MAQFAVAAGLLEVASVGITLIRTLHDLGTTAREAGEQTDLLSKNISHHCRSLKSLGRQIKVDNPDHSAEALDVVRELQEKSDAVLHEIEKLLPSPKRDSDGLSLKQRLIWSLRKSRVDHFVGQLEYLKSTATLLLHVLSSVPKLRKYRRSKTYAPELREEICEALNEAQNLLYERCRAQLVLPELAAEDEVASVCMIAPPDVRSSSPTPPYPIEDMAPHPGNCLSEIDAYANSLSQNDSRAMIMQKTTLWLAQLYGHWTTLSNDDAFDEGEFADLAAAATDDSVVSRASGGTLTETTGQARKVKSVSLGREGKQSYVPWDESTKYEDHPKPKGYLKQRLVPFPEDPNPTREAVAPLNKAGKSGVPPGARWTKISRTLVNPEALEKAKERFEVTYGHVIVLRVLNKDEVARLVEHTREIREGRQADRQAVLDEKQLKNVYHLPTVEEETSSSSADAVSSTDLRSSSNGPYLIYSTGAPLQGRFNKHSAARGANRFYKT